MKVAVISDLMKNGRIYHVQMLIYEQAYKIILIGEMFLVLQNKKIS